MNSRSVLVAGAPFTWTPKLAALAASAETLVAADSGADHLARIGLRPTWVVGDLDSITPSTRAWLGENRIVHRPDQARTDLDKTLGYLFDEINASEVTVLAALGGRSDHETGNLGLLARLAKGKDLVFEADGCRILAVQGAADLPSRPGETWSFWTYDPGVRVTVKGVRWPLEDAAIDVGASPSISNQAVSQQIRIRSTGGSVVVMRRFAGQEKVTS